MEAAIEKETERLIRQRDAGVETKPFRFRGQTNMLNFVMGVWDLVEGVDCMSDHLGDVYVVNLVKRKLT